MASHRFLKCALLFSLLSLAACGGGDESHSPILERGSARLLLGKNSVPFFDSLVVEVDGDSMDSRHFQFSSILTDLRLDDLPPGEARSFSVRVYADGGQLVQQGESVADLRSGEETSLTILLVAVAGFLQVEVVLGLENPYGVVSGNLVLRAPDGAERSVSMQISEGKGFFATGALPLGTEFDMQVELYGADGKILFSGNRKVRIADLLQRETLLLHSAQGGAVLKIELAASEPVQILAALPGSQRRIPVRSGEVFLSEFLPYPKTSGDEFEYFELYNSTLDTLALGSCALGRSRSSAGATSLLPLPTELLLPPMSFVVLGRDSVVRAEHRYSGFIMSNSGQSLALFCGTLLLDSLTYASSTDSLNPFPLEVGKSLQLPLSNWKNRQRGSSWCAGGDSLWLGSLLVRGSPGLDAACN